MSTAKAKHQAQNKRQVNNFTPLISYASAPVQNAVVGTFLSLTTSYLYMLNDLFQTKSPLYFQEFVGNADQDTVVYHELSHAIRARYIRFRPTGWHGHISMRVEVYGCKGNAAFSSAKLAYHFLAVLFHARQKWARVPTKQKTPVTRRI